MTSRPIIIGVFIGDAVARRHTRDRDIDSIRFDSTSSFFPERSTRDARAPIAHSFD